MEDRSLRRAAILHPPSSQPPFQILRRLAAGVAEAEPFVEAAGMPVARAHLERHFATAGLAGGLRNRVQQPAADSPPALRGHDRRVVDVDQRPAVERREPAETDRDTN